MNNTNCRLTHYSQGKEAMVIDNKPYYEISEDNSRFQQYPAIISNCHPHQESLTHDSQ